MYQHHQHGGSYEATGGSHVGVGDHFVTPYHMVEIHQVTARQGRQPLEKIDRRGATLTPQADTAHGADRRQGQGGED